MIPFKKQIPNNIRAVVLCHAYGDDTTGNFRILKYNKIIHRKM